MRAATRTKELIPNTLIKVLEYEKCVNTVLDGGGDRRNEVYLKLTKLSIISQDPGHKFGNPVFYYDVCDYEIEEDEGYASSVSSSILDESHEAAVVVSPHPDTPIVRSSLMLLTGSARRQPFVSESQVLHELYYCQYRIRDKPIDSKVPNAPWQVDSHGVGPGPKCRWIPAASPMVEESGDVLEYDVTDTSSPPNRNDKSPSSSYAPSASIGRPSQRTSSFNAFATSVLPLPVQSRYSLGLNCANSGDSS